MDFTCTRYSLGIKNTKKRTSVDESMLPIINCMYSHASIVKIAEILDYPFVCIFEEDALPKKGIKNILTEYIEHVPTTIDFLLLGWTKTKRLPYSICHKKYWRFIFSHGSHAYIIFKSGYQKYIEAMNNNGVADIVFENLKNIYQTRQNLFLQYNYTESTISKNIGFHNFTPTKYQKMSNDNCLTKK